MKEKGLCKLGVKLTGGVRPVTWAQSPLNVQCAYWAGPCESAHCSDPWPLTHQGAAQPGDGASTGLEMLPTVELQDLEVG